MLACKDKLKFHSLSMCHAMLDTIIIVSHACSNTHSLFVVLHTGYRERWSVCVFIKMVIGYTWKQYLRDMTPSTH